MEFGLIGALIVVLGVIAMCVVLGRHHSRDKIAPRAVALSANSGVQLAASVSPVATHEPPPDSLVFGELVDRPVMTIKKSANWADFEGSRSEPMSARALAHLSSVLQAVPSLLIAKEAAGRQLMEVVINGELTPAMGGGVRAFATEGGKIVEHARLFDSGKLENLINATAVWQVASVLVAQKHLADIGQKLAEIANNVNQVGAFQKDERRSRIKGTYDYLSQIAFTIQQGGLPDVRAQLETCERQLLQIQDHLFVDFRKAVDKKVEDPDLYGSKGLYQGIDAKIDGLADLMADIELCVWTRIGAWHVLSAYPGESALIQVRRESLERTVHELSELTTFVEQKLEPEIVGLTAKLTRKSTLQNRRELLASNCDSKKASLRASADKATNSMQGSMHVVMLEHHPIRILLAIDGAKIVGARQVVAEDR